MAHDPTLHWPLGQAPGDKSIPGTAILQNVDGEILPVTGAANLVKSSGGVWMPVSQDNRLPVEATLSGSNMPEGVSVPVQLTGPYSVLIRRRDLTQQENNVWLHAGAVTTNEDLIIPMDVSGVRDIAIVMRNGGSNTFRIQEIRYYGGLSKDDLLFVSEYTDELAAPSGKDARVIFDAHTDGLEALGKPWIGLAIKYTASNALDRTIAVIGGL